MQNSHEKKARRYATLLAGYMRKNLTQDEHDELDQWVGASDKNMRLFEELTDERRVKLALALLNDEVTDTEMQEQFADITPIKWRMRWKKLLNRAALFFLIAWAIIGIVHVITEKKLL